MRAKVEYPFHVVKNLFGHHNSRCRRLAKDKAQLFSLYGLANLVLAVTGSERSWAQVRPERGKRR